MDDRRFDDIARALAARRGRRGFVLGLVGAAVGLVTTSPAVAACPAGQVLRRGVGCVCKTTGRPPANGGCPCAHGQYRCNGVCSRGPCEPSDPPSCSPATCPAPGVCRDGVCCQPRGACAEDECGPVDDGCGGTLDCGPCCEPDCDGKQCGDDGCGGSCGECEERQSCTLDGVCRIECGSSCTGPSCACPPCQQCNSSGVCQAVACGGAGLCSVDQCNPISGQCEPVAVDDGTPCADPPGVCCDGACLREATVCPLPGCASDAECGGGRCCGGTCLDVEVCPQCATDGDCLDLGLGSYCAPVSCASGICRLHPDLHEGLLCPSLDPCKESSGVCVSGECRADDLDCSEFDGPCSIGVCDPIAGCRSQAVREGMACGGPDSASGQCLSGGVCAGGICTGGFTTGCGFVTDPCNDSVCDPVVGCQAVPLSGIACTSAPCISENTSTCQTGVCVGGVPVGNGSNPASPGGGVCPAGQLCSNGVCRVCEPPGTFLTGGSCAEVGEQCCGGCEEVDAGTPRCLA